MINRNNYEEYFLLLADNELSVEEAAAVRHFAAQHRDLAEELNLLLSCKLDIGPIPVFPKEKLLRPLIWNVQQPEPLQTQMILLLDEELPFSEREQLQKQIAQDASLQAEWNTLQQTKLTAEAVVHPSKQVLRRSALKVRPLLWMRWATAAAVVAGLGWMFSLQQESRKALPASNVVASHVVQEPTVIAAVRNTDTPSIVIPDILNEPMASVATTMPATQSKNTLQSTVQVQQSPIPLAANTNSQPTETIIPENGSADPEPLTARQMRGSNTDLRITDDLPASAMEVAHLEPAATKLLMSATSRKMEPFIGNKSAVLTEEEPDYVTIGGAHVNKQKMRGLFRNVTRTVTRSFSKSKMEPDVYVAR